MYSRFDEETAACHRNGSTIKTIGSRTAEMYHFGVRGMKWKKRMKKNKDKVNDDDSPSFGNDVIRLQEKRKKYLASPVTKSKNIFSKAKKATAKKVTTGADSASTAMEKAKASARQKTFDRMKSGQKAITSTNLAKNKLKTGASVAALYKKTTDSAINTANTVIRQKAKEKKFGKTVKKKIRR